jgi:hypothetical protein
MENEHFTVTEGATGVHRTLFYLRKATENVGCRASARIQAARPTRQSGPMSKVFRQASANFQEYPLLRLFYQAVAAGSLETAWLARFCAALTLEYGRMSPR